MAWEDSKTLLLEAVTARIAEQAAEADRDRLLQLAAQFLGSFPAEDLHGRQVADVYGTLYGLSRFVDRQTPTQPRVRVFNPSLENHGWESRRSILVVHCRDMPFVTASVRGEMHRQQVSIHTLTSCNFYAQRTASGELESLAGSRVGVPGESLLYFELQPETDRKRLAALQQAVAAVVTDVALVVDDFSAMRERVSACLALLEQNGQVAVGLRKEAAAFLRWLQRDHMTFLGYEYLEVEGSGGNATVTECSNSRLGLLRHRSSSGVPDLAFDLAQLSTAELKRKQLSFSKSRLRSRVHRAAYPDYIEIKVFDEAGNCCGQHRFLGLYTASVYNDNAREIPILRRKIDAVMAQSGSAAKSHAGRELLRVLETFPRDELFQSSIDELRSTCEAVNRIQERRQVRLFVRQDRHNKFFNCLLYVPRDRYHTEMRQQVETILSRAFAAEESEFNTFFSESVLVRCHFVLRVNPAHAPSFDLGELEEQIVQTTLSWQDRLRDRLVEEFGEETGADLLREFGSAFPPGYQSDFDPRIAVTDIRRLRKLQSGESLTMSLYRMLEEEDAMLRLRLYHSSSSLPLSDVLPILENLGLRVVSERPYAVRSANAETFWIQEFSLVYTLAQDIDLEQVRQEFEDAFSRIWFGEAESDSFNRLLIGTRLSWREIALLRAYARYLRQLQFNFSVDYIAETMAAHLPITASIVELFLTRFSPVFDGDEDWRGQRELAVEGRILDSLEQVQNLGQDRIIRQYLAVIKATLRTNFFQQDDAGNLKSYFSLKFNTGQIPEVPRPVPRYEIFVYSPRVEGVHLRGGKVARGGLRWSDRMEDYRTEVLGLVKAQQVKNSVIVPVGAKGGFVARKLSADMDREQRQEEGIACYRLFIRGLLDVTDNRRGDEVISPPGVVAKDDEDPYLVVAADKGTATFSDIANELASDYSFWLGDAFASGGSVGYDHKKMGITARGAWVSVQRHFRELGVDVQHEPVTVVGIGDMAGDVFGNGMLLSPCLKLVAAFNHAHIFIDPEPDPAQSFAERQRLFLLPRSSWSDYDAALISEGGGVFSRDAKSITVTMAMKHRFGITADRLTPAELISQLLQAQVDLLWNGGIGTYVKSSLESHTDVGDKANDALRVNGSDLRCRVVGEGGNLGLTQLGRVEYALHGGRVNTDFIDNAGGVDCSDHEVNIKILLNSVVERGDMTLPQRDALLESMTDSVAALVLHNNYRQAQALSLIELQAATRSEEYRQFIEVLVTNGGLDRELEYLPDNDTISERRSRGQHLVRPELAVLLSYSKAIMKARLAEMSVSNDGLLQGMVESAFPPELRERFATDIHQHRLQQEILATQIANTVVNRMGLNFMMRLQRATGADFPEMGGAYLMSVEVFAVDALWERVEALEHSLPAEKQLGLMQSLSDLVRKASRWVIRNRRHHLQPAKLVAEFGPPVAALKQLLPALLLGTAAEAIDARRIELLDCGVPEDLAADLAACSLWHTLLGVADAARASGQSPEGLAELYFNVGHALELDWFAQQISDAGVQNEWQALARDALLEDLEWQQRTLAMGAMRYRADNTDTEACVQAWLAGEDLLVSRWRTMLIELHGVENPDFAMFTVANRELQDLAQSSLRQSADSGLHSL